jgi:hypothetical protein
VPPVDSDATTSPLDDPLQERRVCWEPDCRGAYRGVRTVAWHTFTVRAECHGRTYRRRDMIDGRPGRWIAP